MEIKWNCFPFPTVMYPETLLPVISATLFLELEYGGILPLYLRDYSQLLGKVHNTGLWLESHCHHFLNQEPVKQMIRT